MGKRIMFIIHDINYGGAAKMLSYLANQMSATNDNIYVYTYAGNSDNYELSEKVHICRSEKIVNNKIIRFFATFLTVRRMIAKIEPDVVISFLTNANLYNVVGTAFTNIPSVIAERGDPYMEDNIVNRIKKYFYKYAEGAVFQTEGAKSFYNKSLQNRSMVIPNPVTVPQCDIIPYKKRNNDIVFVARFDIKQKRQDIMVEAFAKVAEQNDNVRLVFYGDGKDSRIVEQLVDELGLSSRVIFAGKVTNIISKIKNAKISVLTSDYEGIPNAIIESMVAGVPVVSTDCSPGGARLLIKNGVNGIIVPRRDINKVAESILFLINNPLIAEEYANEAIKIRTEYSPNKILKLWDQYIDKVVEKHV